MTVDAVGGKVDLAIGSVAVLTTHVRAGRLRPIPITGDKRSHTMPDVPALSEQGFPGFSAPAWWGALGPAGIRQSVLARFHGLLVKTLGHSDPRAQLSDRLGMDLVVSTPAERQKFVPAEVARRGKVVRDHKIRPD